MSASARHSNGTAARGRLGVLRRLVSGRRPAAALEDGEDRVFGDQLDLELERAKRGARPLSLLVGALTFTDDQGEPISRPAADDAFTVVAAVVAEEKRRIDTVARIGVDSFALILPETSEAGALAFSERLRRTLSWTFTTSAQTPRVSFGIASFPRHGRAVVSLTAAAQRALDAARSLGGDRSLLESVETPATIVSVGQGDPGSDGRLETILALVETVDIRDQGRAGHAQTVGRYAEQIARELGLPVKRSDRIRLAAMLHDVGKVAVPGALLAKSGPLDAGEWAAVRKHSEAGASMLVAAGLDEIAEWVLAHHERPDGEGYPRGLAFDEIALEARIIAVADAYESMTSKRPYRDALTHEAAQAELVECAGTQFDERVVDAFMRVLEREGVRSRSRPVPSS